MDKLRILAVGDVHSDHAFILTLADQAEKENVDLVVLAGDLTYGDENTDGIVGPFKAKGKHVLLVHGNHETPATADFLANLYDATNLNGTGVEINGVGIFGMGGASIGPNHTSQHDIYEQLQHAHERIKTLSRKLMVVHEHPSGTLMEMGGMFPGSWAVRKSIEKFQPDFAVCGHIHEAGGIEQKIGRTTVINVARTPRIIEI
jgi:Icc-related predicted phosphoesterase